MSYFTYARRHQISSAVWHGAGEERVKVTVSETHIETLFCQKNEGTDGKFSGKPKKVHLC